MIRAACKVISCVVAATAISYAAFTYQTTNVSNASVMSSQNRAVIEKPIIMDTAATDVPSCVSSDIPEQDAISRSFDVSNESWGTDKSYVNGMIQHIVQQNDTGKYAIAIDTSLCRVGIFKRDDNGTYSLDHAFNADLGYIDNVTKETHTFTGAWHIDHRTVDGPEGASYFTCFVPCWGKNGEDDGQGFHSGYDGSPSYESAGCTRLFYNDAKYISENIPDGTLVLVY